MKDKSPTPFVEKILAFVGLVSCLISVFWSYSVVLNQQPLWLLPGLYLVEMLAASILAAYGVLGGSIVETWIAVGIMLGFSLMGAWTIGLAFIPSTLIFIVAAMMVNRKASQGMGKYSLLGALACAFQIVLMMIVTRI